MALISIDSGRGGEAVRGLADTLEMPLISLTAPLYPQDPTNLWGPGETSPILSLSLLVGARGES